MRTVLAANLLSRWMPSDFGAFVSLFVESFLCLGTAVLCGLIIGAEREKKQKPAGLRTHILVGLGSAAFVHLGAVAHTVGGFGTVSRIKRVGNRQRRLLIGRYRCRRAVDLGAITRRSPDNEGLYK